MITYAPRGRLLVSGDRVCCHLCGRWFLSVASHLRVHGWTKELYVEAFGLERSNPLCGLTTTKRRAAALTGRLAVEPALRQAQVAARERARSGALTGAAAAAARGRPHPPERRRKTLAALAGVDPDRQAVANRARAEHAVRATAAIVAAAHGHPTFADWAAERIAAGRSLAAISREAGQHRNWLARHRDLLLPSGVASDPDARWPVADVGAFLRLRHGQQHRTVAAIADETGLARATVVAALRRHGVVVEPHSGTRSAAVGRDGRVAATMGFASLDAYVAERRARGTSWAGIAGECGVPASTLRRRAG